MQVLNFSSSDELGPAADGFAGVAEPFAAIFEPEPPQPTATRTRRAETAVVLMTVRASLTAKRLVRLVNTWMRIESRATERRKPAEELPSR
jgi:hypothetical protein